MPLKLWVQLKSNNDAAAAVNRPTQVPTKDCENVDDFIEAVKKNLSPKLDQVAVDDITLHLTEDADALRPGLSLSNISSQPGYIANADETPLIVMIPPPAAPSLSLSHASVYSSDDEPHPKRLKRWKEINKVLINKRKALNDSTPYSFPSWSTVSPIFLSERKLYVQSSIDIPTGDFEVLLTMLTWVYRCYGRTLIEDKNKNETQRLHLIAPVLWSVVQLLPDVEVRVEHTLDGKRIHAHGRFEFVLTRQVKGVAKRLCIVEAKHEDFEQGLAQSLLGCEVAADLDKTHVVYGIVTNFEKWIFVKDLDEEIAIDENNLVGFDSDGVPIRDQLMTVAGKIYALLSHVRSDISERWRVDKQIMRAGLFQPINSRKAIPAKQSNMHNNGNNTDNRGNWQQPYRTNGQQRPPQQQPPAHLQRQASVQQHLYYLQQQRLQPTSTHQSNVATARSNINSSGGGINTPSWKDAFPPSFRLAFINQVKALCQSMTHPSTKMMGKGDERLTELARVTEAEIWLASPTQELYQARIQEKLLEFQTKLANTLKMTKPLSSTGFPPRSSPPLSSSSSATSTVPSAVSHSSATIVKRYPLTVPEIQKLAELLRKIKPLFDGIDPLSAAFREASESGSVIANSSTATDLQQNLGKLNVYKTLLKEQYDNIDKGIWTITPSMVELIHGELVKMFGLGDLLRSTGGLIHSATSLPSYSSHNRLQYPAPQPPSSRPPLQYVPMQPPRPGSVAGFQVTSPPSLSPSSSYNRSSQSTPNRLSLFNLNPRGGAHSQQINSSKTIPTLPSSSSTLRSSVKESTQASSEASKLPAPASIKTSPAPSTSSQSRQGILNVKERNSAGHSVSLTSALPAPLKSQSTSSAFLKLPSPKQLDTGSIAPRNRSAVTIRQDFLTDVIFLDDAPAKIAALEEDIFTRGLGSKPAASSLSGKVRDAEIEKALSSISVCDFVFS